MPSSWASARRNASPASSGGWSGNGCPASAAVEVQLAVVRRVGPARPAPRTTLAWASANARPAWSPWPGTTTPRSGSTRAASGRGRRHPVERIAVAEERDVALLQQVAGPDHVRPRHGDDRVVVGVAATEEPQLDVATADLDRGRSVERPIRRVDDDLGEVVGQVRLVGGDGRLAPLTGALHERHAARLAPDRGRPEDGVAEGMVEMAVGVDDDRDRVARSPRARARRSRAPARRSIGCR